MEGFCSTKLRKPTKEEQIKFDKLITENPQKSNESDEDYIMRLINLSELLFINKYKWNPSSINKE